MARLQLSGERFGRLTAVRDVGADSGRGRLWLCSCDCGGATTVRATHLRSGATQSCGCLNRELCARMRERKKPKHGYRKTPTYNSWYAMKSRCQNKNDHAYSRYGGRGVMVCDRWDAFENFLADMGERPTGTTLDRIDNDGNYKPDNCRWSTPKEQGRNRRDVVLSVDLVKLMRFRHHFGDRIVDIARERNLNIQTASAAIHGRNWL